jgi:hypothetical protein
MIEVDPKIEQAFAEVLARSRHRAEDIADRVAAVQRGIEERSKQLLEEGRRLTEELDRKAAEQQENERNPWQNRPARSTVLEFGSEDEERRPAPPTQPIPAQQQMPPAAAFDGPPPPPPEPEPEPGPPPKERVLSFGLEDEESEPAPPRRPASRPRPAASDDDEDWSGRSWMR